MCAPPALAFGRDQSLPDPSPFIRVPNTTTPNVPGDAGEVGWVEIDNTSAVNPPGGGEQVIPASTGAENSLAITLIKLVWNELTGIVVKGASNPSF